MLIINKGRVFTNVHEATEGTGWSLDHVESIIDKLQGPRYNSCNWALADENDTETIESGILATTHGDIDNLEIKLSTSQNRIKSSQVTIERETAVSEALQAKLELMKTYVSKCVETLGNPDD